MGDQRPETATQRTLQVAQALSESTHTVAMPASSKHTLNENGIPPYEALPLRKSDPFVAAWGLYGDNDELGTLNRLTPDRVVAAAKEIRSGNRVGLDWALSDNAINGKPFYGRQGFKLQVVRHPGDSCGNDDVWTFNPQASSQWDGLRHVGFPKEKLFYNGVTMDQIHAVDTKGNRSTVNGVHAWAKQGIVGRGVLVDFHSWRVANNKWPDFDAFAACRIPLSDLKECLVSQGTEVHFGDILLVRSGFMHAMAGKSLAELRTIQERPHADIEFCGVDTTPELLKWIWENFSAVAGDQPAFEAWPFKNADDCLHAACLPSWGCPIGELFNLEALAGQCKKERRWSFFLTSEPCNVPGAVASPPNALAIF
ncbi:cyclase family protein [Microdochium nivale]|nr:cyclase family protein [Microdochium nivale]